MTLQKIILIRHAQSIANAEHPEAYANGDCNVPLSEEGKMQAITLGEKLGRELLASPTTLLYTSPYERTRATMNLLLASSGANDVAFPPKVYEDPRLRELEVVGEGYKQAAPKRMIHGWFYYRFQGGESPADVYDRVSASLESIMRQVQRHSAETVVIVSHGIAIRCFITRFLHLKVEDYCAMRNPKNCSVVTIDKCGGGVFTSSSWGVRGIILRTLETPSEEEE